MDRLGLIAGTGSLPAHILNEAGERGFDVFIIGLTGFTDPLLGSKTKNIFWVKLGQIDRAVAFLRENNITRLVMAGKIEKSNLLKPWNLRLDRRALRIIRNLKDWRDDTILAALAHEFASDGLIVDEITNWATKLMAPLGVITRRRPTERQWGDIEFGRRMAQGIGALDMGQTVVVKNSAVIAAEAIEGTDKCILRAGELGITDCVVVKTAKPKQDMRFDVPGVGPKTLDSMIKSGASVLAVEAGKTMIVELRDTLNRADEARVSIVGIPPEGPVRESRN